MMRTYRTRRGAALVWSVTALLVLLALAGLGLDWARVTLVKTQMRQAADAAALAAAARLGDGTKEARKYADKARLANLVDGKAAHLADIKYSGWNDDFDAYTMVEVVLERSSAHGGRVPTLFGQFLGYGGKELTVRAKARITFGADVTNHHVDGEANPFLSGMPEGTVASRNNPHNSPDYAGNLKSSKVEDWKQSPPPVKKLTLTPGDELEFGLIAGDVRHDPNLPYFNPDGELTDIGRNTNGSEHGISDLNAPINALVGVFLGPDQPNYSSAPESLNYGSHEMRNRDRYEPKLKQLFWIGDGRFERTVDGKKVKFPQKFVVPPGATRLYLATWDFYEWNNNDGWRDVRITRRPKTQLIE